MAAFFGLGGTTAVAASGYFYDCDIGQQTRGNTWVSPKMAIIVQADGRVLVLDGIALAANDGAPFPARVTRNTDTRMVVRWVIEDIADSNGLEVPHFEYAATLDKQTGRVTVVATPENFAGRFSGKGSCVVRTGTS